MNYGEFGGQYVSSQLKEKLNYIKKNFNELKKWNVIVIKNNMGKGIEIDLDKLSEFSGNERNLNFQKLSFEG